MNSNQPRLTPSSYAGVSPNTQYQPLRPSAFQPPPAGATIPHTASPPQASTSAAPIVPAKGGAGGVKRKAPAPKDKDKDKDGKKGERKTRSRLACLACKSTKQKCDGPSRIPCRRCELYGLECKFPTAPGVVFPPSPPVPSTSTSGPNGLMTEKLFEIAARLQSIESALHVQYLSPPSPRALSSRSQRSMSPGSSDDGMHQDEEGNVNTNPIQEINQSLDQVVGPANANGRGVMSSDDYGAPDVLRRGILTAEECQALFDFFFGSIHPWVMMLSLDEDRDALGVRSRSSLLFHTVLLLSTSYSTPFPSQLHTTLITFLNSILAPQILNPQPHELTTDFLRAIDLLNLYKPTQLAARRAEGKDEAEAMRASKVNGLASWMLQGILARTAERLELSSVVNKFARAQSASPTGAAIPSHVLRDLRLYYWLLSNDVHGNVQSGRRCNMEGAAALSTTRIFSSLQLQPYDTRLAASVEMFEVARPILRSFSYERTRRISKPDLERYNVGMSAWEEFWLPVLQRQLGVDPLAMSVLCPFAWFISLTYNATCFVSWKQNRMYGSDSGGEGGGETKVRRVRTEGARGLTQWEFEGLQKCVKAAEGLIFMLSVESRVAGGWRAIQWEEAERTDGWRKLVMDETVVALSKWGMDAITCVAYIFPLVFLGKLVNEGILTADLVLLQSPTPQQPWLYTQKLPRLLELGASFLDAISLNASHPARAQAQVLRTLLDTGVKGRSPTPQPPRHASTVLSPAPDIFSPPTTRTPLASTSWHQSPQPNGAGSPTSLMPYPQTGAGPPRTMDPSFTAVLDGFDPLFGETSAFWEWGGLGTGTDVDWAAVQASMRH